MKFSIDGQVVLLRAPEGPLAAYIKRFAGSLSEQTWVCPGFDSPAGFSRYVFQPVAQTPGSRAAQHHI